MPSYTELQRLESAIVSHGGVFREKFDSLLNETAGKHDDYKEILLHCWNKLHWRPAFLDTQVIIKKDCGCRG